MKKLFTSLILLLLITTVSAIVNPPTITSFTPILGNVGTTVTITGTYFSTTPANNIVYFGATRATVSAATSTSLTVTVPSGAIYAPISVLNTDNSLSCLSTNCFTPTYPPPHKSLISTGDYKGKQDFSTAVSPENVVIIDIDGDGKPDMVTANDFTNTISILRNTSTIGTLSFAGKVDYPTSSYPGPIAVADLDGDGKPDIVVPNTHSNNISVYLNTSTVGTISFAAAVNYTTDSYPAAVAIGDLDGDGKPDLVVSGFYASYVSIFPNACSPGTIGFAAKIELATGAAPDGVVVGDLDGDGKPDIAVGNSGDNTISVYRNITLAVGSIAFTPQTVYATPNYPGNLTLADLDVDGKPDLITTNYNGGSFSVFRNISTSGTITFDPRVEFSTGVISRPNYSAIGDLDGDGIPDIAVVSQYFNRVYLFRNLTKVGSSVLSFASKVSLITGDTPSFVSIGDLDGDGKPDLAVSNFAANTISAYLYTQLNSWTGASNSSWATTTNWSANMIPGLGDDILIPNVPNKPYITVPQTAVTTNMTVASGSFVTITPGNDLTVAGVLTNNATGGVVIQSDASNTGSLIAGSVAGTGTATILRYLTSAGWHMVTSPVTGQLISNFLTTNTSISTSGITRGMMDYNPTPNTWNAHFTNTHTGTLPSTVGFAMHTAFDDFITFTGGLQAGIISASSLIPDSWNCIGNPYTSTIGINTNWTNTDNFLNVNGANLDPSFGGIYVWEKADAFNGQYGQYTVITNVPTYYEIQQAQGFFVKMNRTATSVSFTPDMQYHNGTLAFRSAVVPWPMIKLVVTSNNLQHSTLIAFNSAMTNGLDPTYDAGLLKGGADLLVYTRLVKDNGIPFAVQALPDNDFNNLTIPIGVDYKSGGEVVFSANAMQLPSNCTVILEDKLAKTFTDLTKSDYRVMIAANTSTSDRFLLHTSNVLPGLVTNQKLSAFANRNIEIRLNGSINQGAIATLYDIHGRIVLVKNLVEGNLNIIPTPKLKTGIYMLSVNDNGKVTGLKLMVNE